MKTLTDIKENFAEWYQDVISEAQLVDNSPTRGCFVIMPYGYALWERMQAIVDKKIKSTGTQNISLPLLIPQSFLTKEAKHVEGFAPEVAVVTHAGGKELEEPYVIRPTSETIVYYMFAKWIKSYRDLPMKINQWANVVRWEMRTRAFLRTTEFHWQEGHTAHATFDEAREMALTMLNHYKDLAERYLAIPVITGEKSASERFAGADATYTFEAIMPDGRALQMGTSHMLAQSFSAAFDVKFQDKDGQVRSPFCTSWAITTRLIGALVMTHGDERGMIVPPKIAPIHAVIVPIFKTEEQRVAIMQCAERIKEEFAEHDIVIHIDADDQKTPGAKYYHWEVRGVPVRIEIGPRDLENKQVVLVNRLETDKDKKKKMMPLDNLHSGLPRLLEEIQQQLFERAQQKLKNNWHQADKLDEFGKKMDDGAGAYQVGWCGSSACEETLKAFKGTIRCILEQSTHKECFSCTQASKNDILVARSY